MRRLLPLFAAVLFAVPAFAQTPAPPRQPRQTMAQRFDAANTTHDGHLTRDQASAGKLRIVVRNFDTIDKDHKGFVTVEDIRNYTQERRAQRKAKNL